MKRTKREEKSIIIHLAFFSISFIGIVIYFLVSILPGIKEIEVKKENLKSTYTELEKVLTKGPEFTEFKQTAAKSIDKEEDSSYRQNILTNIDQTFYNSIIYNTGSLSYEEYLADLESQYADESEYYKKLEITSNVLPYYSKVFIEGNNSDEEGGLVISLLSDYKFINYVESIIETFNITFDNYIGIESIDPVEGYSITGGDSSLETGIYKIPLTLDVTGTKESIINLVHYIEEVGKISISEDDELTVDRYKDNGSFPIFNSIALKGQLKPDDYNIFNNQMIDIERIEFTEYIDSSYEDLDETKTVIYNVLQSQGKQYYEASIVLNFYIKGIPVFMLEDYIDSVVTKYNTTKLAIAAKLKDKTISANKRNNLSELQKTLVGFSKTTILDLEEAKKTKEGIEEAYLEASILSETLDNYLKEIE